MPYNDKQYDAAMPFLRGSQSENVTDYYDSIRLQMYDLYENIYRNSINDLKLSLRGDDQNPVFIPHGRKIIEAHNRFLAKNMDYYIEPTISTTMMEALEVYFNEMFIKQKLIGKFNSNKRWGMIRGDAYFFIDGDEQRSAGQRIRISELDPRRVFEIEEHPYEPDELTGVHLVDLVQDPRDSNPEKKVARRRTFRKIYDEETITVIGVTTELTFWEIGKWDDRTPQAREKMSRVPTEKDQEATLLPNSIVKLPVFKWSNDPAPNSSWGVSQLAGLETAIQALNQSLSDEDATLVFQGLGMYVTDAPPPRNPDDSVGAWNIGPAQVIEIAPTNKFERVSGVSTTAPMAEHMNYINDNACQASGTPQTAIGRVDVSSAESGIALKLELMPIIAANNEKEYYIINAMDALFTQIASMWLPAYEPELFGSNQSMVDEMSMAIVTVIFDDAMPKDRKAEIDELIQLDQANLILKTMVIAKLKELGYKYPDSIDGEQIDDNVITLMLMDQISMLNQAMDPYFGFGAGGDDEGSGNGGSGKDDTPEGDRGN